jgi:methionine aminopeptidase
MELYLSRATPDLDDSLSAHFEHTDVVTRDVRILLTPARAERGMATSGR